MCDGKRVRLLGLCDREHKARELTDAEDKIVDGYRFKRA
jgi:hypothetical protein